MNDIITYVGMADAAQNAIDTFIGYWITGLKKIFGDDATQNDSAPVPFYASGGGYWQCFNDSIVSDTYPDNLDFNYSYVSWTVNDCYVNLITQGLVNSNQPTSWNNAVANYWSSSPIKPRPNFEYIASHDVYRYGFWVSSDTADPTCITGFNPQNRGQDNCIIGEWYAFDGSVYETFNEVTIRNNRGYIDSNYVKHGDIDRPLERYENRLVLPMSADSYWFFCGDTYGNDTIINNFFNDFDSHNTNNTYYDNTEYNEYYNTFNISISPNFDFNVGVGPFGIALGVGGIGGGALNVNPSVSFDDLVDILTPVIVDLNNNAGYDTDIVIHDFSYYMSNYNDMGDFYIEPLHQYDNISDAPAFDGSVNFGDIPKVVGESANSYLALLGGTLSALLCGCFITALIVRKMGR